MRNFPLTIILIACWLVLATCEQFGHESVPSGTNRGANTLLGASDLETVGDNNDPNNIDKRVERYAFGLGRRAYTYTAGGSGVKRLPVYNFGLGKRARPYSFGLGKRFDVDNQEYQDFEGNNNDDGLYELPAPSNSMS